MKKALITGVTGQDGSYLAEFLLEKGYEVYGMVRRTSTNSMNRIQHLPINIVYGDLLDQQSISNIVFDVRPDEIYNLAAQSFVHASFGQPIFTGDCTGLGVTRVLEAIKNIDPTIRFYQASSSEIFGKVAEDPQSETTPCHPRSPYGVAKLYGYWMTINYRESYGIHASNGILYNHCSPRRGIEFVTRKIVDGACKISLGQQDKLHLGNLDVERDWGHARDYVEAMWLMLQQDQPDDYVVATGEKHTVREFCDIAFKVLGLDYRAHVVIDERFWRPAEVNTLCGNYNKAKKILNWQPKITFRNLVTDMVIYDYHKLSLKHSENS